ncbi:MAG: ABC transporter ATP-binding protein [Eubacteriales bacterium]
MKKYFKYIAPYKQYFVLSPLLMLLEVYCDVKIPILSANIINIGVTNSDTAQVISLALQMVFFTLLAAASGISASYCASKAAVYFSSDLRADIFKKIQDFSFKNIDDFSTGSLVTRLTNDITQLQQLVILCLRMLFRAPGMLFGALIMAYTINKQLSIIFVLLVPILTIIIYVILNLSYKKFSLLQLKIDALNSSVREVLTNIRVIKGLTREGYEDKRFHTVNEDLKDTGLSAYRITILQLPLMTLVVNFATIAILWFGSKALGREDIMIGDISAFITYLTQILMSVNMFAMIFLQGSRALVSGARISEVLETNVDVTDKDAAVPDKKVNSGDIRFEHVDFKYYKSNQELVLSDISVHITSGQTVGIIGSTGCGKTSFVHLIPRLYDVDGGSVYVDDTNVKDYSLKNLRDGVSVVLQNNVLFSGTIKENLLWGDKNASDEEIKTVADWSAASEFIESKRKGYDSQLDQGGLNLSGGQKQRLCIARALLKKPKILILDDSTSAVDTATEANITSHLHNELKDTTKIIIAQRITSVMAADFIIVMNDGTIEAIGHHDELLKDCITYQEIYHSQMDKEVKS